MQAILPDNRVVYYYTEGKGPPMLFLHGAGGDADASRPLTELVRDHYTCIAMDRLGYHRSARLNADTTPREQADAVAAVHAACTDGPAWVYGYSCGGNFAVAYALYYPERVRGLILYEPTLYSAVPADDPLCYAPVLEKHIVPLFRDGRVEEGIRVFFEMVFPGLEFDKLKEAERWEVFHRNFGALYPELAPVLHWVPQSEEWRRLDLPALVLEGNATVPFIRRVTAAVAGRLPRIERITVPGVNHAGPILAPQLIAPHIRAFIERVESRAA